MTDAYSLPMPMSHYGKHREPIVSPNASYEQHLYDTSPGSSSHPMVLAGNHSRRSSVSTSSLSSSSYAGSAADEIGPNGESPADDLVGHLTERLIGAFDPIPLDRSLAMQAQTSGMLNAKNRELMELQALAQRRLAETRANFLDGMRAAKEVKADLDWVQKKVNTLKTKAEQKYPVEYNMAKDRYPYPSEYGY